CRHARAVNARTRQQQPVLHGRGSEAAEGGQKRPRPEGHRPAVLVADEAELVRVAERDPDDVAATRPREAIATKEPYSTNSDVGTRVLSGAPQRRGHVVERDVVVVDERNELAIRCLPTPVPRRARAAARQPEDA